MGWVTSFRIWVHGLLRVYWCLNVFILMAWIMDPHAFHVSWVDDTADISTAACLVCILLKEFFDGARLESYRVMIVDETHERALSTYIHNLVSISMTRRSWSHVSHWYFIHQSSWSRLSRWCCCRSCTFILLSHLEIFLYFSGEEEIEGAKEILLQRTRGLETRIRELLIRLICAAFLLRDKLKYLKFLNQHQNVHGRLPRSVKLFGYFYWKLGWRLGLGALAGVRFLIEVRSMFKRAARRRR